MWFYVVSANSEWSFTVVNPALFTCTRLSNLLFSISISWNVAGFILARVPLIPHHNGAQATPNHKNLFSFCPLYAHPPPPHVLCMYTLSSAGSDRCFQLDSDLRLIVLPVLHAGRIGLTQRANWGWGGAESAAQLSCDQCFFLFCQLF